MPIYKCQTRVERNRFHARWWRSIVVRPPVLPACFPYPCARLTALWVKRTLSVSQQGRFSLPSLRGRLNE